MEEEETNNNDINININLPLISNDKPKQEDNPFILPPEVEISDTITISKCNCGNICKIIKLIILVLCSIIPVFLMCQQQQLLLFCLLFYFYILLVFIFSLKII